MAAGQISCSAIVSTRTNKSPGNQVKLSHSKLIKFPSLPPKKYSEVATFSSPAPDVKCLWNTAHWNASASYNTSVFNEVKCLMGGGRKSSKLLADGMNGIKQIGVLGCNSQEIAEAQMLRASLAEANAGTVVKIGLPKGSLLLANAREAGFTEENGTLGDISETTSGSDLVLLFMSDTHQIPIAPLGVNGSSFSQKLHVQDNETNYAGLNSCYAIVQDVDGRAADFAIALSIVLGSRFTFASTVEQERMNLIPGKKGSPICKIDHICKSKVGDRVPLLDDVVVLKVIFAVVIVGLAKQFLDNQRPCFTQITNNGNASLVLGNINQARTMTVCKKNLGKKELCRSQIIQIGNNNQTLTSTVGEPARAIPPPQYMNRWHSVATMVPLVVMAIYRALTK